MYFGDIVCFFHLWWFSCGGLTGEESLGLFAFEIHSSHARQWLLACLLQIVSHNAAQRQRTEVIFFGLKMDFLPHFLELKTLTTEPREKTDHMMRGGRLVILVCVCACRCFESRMRWCWRESLGAHSSEMSSATLSKHLAQCRSMRS